MSLLLALSLAASVAAGDTTAALMGPGISHELALRRAAQISDVRYDLALDVTRSDTATGRVAITFTWDGRGDVILDWRGLALGSARLRGKPIAGMEANGAHIRVPAGDLERGRNVLSFEFASAIAPAGASIIRFHDSSDGADYLYTLLVPADANALFPCFDQPDIKARVTFALTARPGWKVLANGSELGVDTTAAGVRHRFRQTEPLPTYLIAFAAGPWTRFTRTVDGREIALWVRASRAKEVESDSLLDANARALRWLGRYFARPYPFQKFAFLLAPAFPFGGMEHPGAIFYNEESFIYRERPTVTQRIGRESTIYHEVAHQWFGDLVTMKWFDDLWLKEGFATYMAAKIQADLRPAANPWMTFYLRTKPPAYGVDVTAGTTPIWQELGNLDQAKSNYGAIVYNKAPAVLEQLDHLVGDSAFRIGLQHYLTAHAYGNATWRDLLDAVGAAAHRSLVDWGKQYILRPGIPVFEQHWAAGQDTLTIVQHPMLPLSGAGVWPARIEVLVGYDHARAARIPVTVTSATTRVALPHASDGSRPAYVFANSRDYGYGIFLIDSTTARWVESHLGSVRDDFQRAMLWGAMWDLVQQRRIPPERYVALALRELPAERNEQIVPSILGRTGRAVTAYLSDAERDSILPSLERTLWAAAADSTRPYGLRKPPLDALISLASTPAMLGRLDSLLDGTTVAGEPLRAPTRWAIVTTLVARARPTAEQRLAEEMRRDSTTEGKRRAFAAGAARPTAANKAAYFDRYFSDSTLNEDWVTASLRAFNDPRQQALTLPYLVPALDTLPWIQRNRRIFFLGSWIDAFMAGQTTAEAAVSVDRFLAGHPTLPLDLRQKILQAADELRRTVAIRAR